LSAGDARHGRRDNGLEATEYAAAGDVDPRVGEHLLDVLALDGIAAYLRPSTDLHPVTRSSTLPGRPTDRLYVDRIHLATARDYLSRLAEEPDGSVTTRGDRGEAPREEAMGEEAVREEAIREDAMRGETIRDETVRDQTSREQAVRDQARRDQGTSDDGMPGSQRPGDARPADNIDDEWAKIVAGFDADFPGRSWPDAEDLPESTRATPSLFPERDERPAERPEPVRREEPSLLDGLDTFGANLPDPEEDGYEPPTPPPVPRPSAPTVLAVAGIIIGLIIFLKPGLAPVSESVAMLAGFTAVVAGFATLVWRLRPGDEEDDNDPDHGARV
jgi:hypothetical protein